MVPQNLTSELPKIAAAVRAEFLHRMRAKHSVALELPLEETAQRCSRAGMFRFSLKYS